MSKLPSPITRLALLAAAMRVPLHVPKCSLTDTQSKNCKTNPTEHSGTSPASSSFAEIEMRQTKPTEHSGTSHDDQDQNCKTNPTEHLGTLSDTAAQSAAPGRAVSPLSNRQLAAARYLARGRGSTETAQRLGITRQTVARWNHNPAFAAEVQRLHTRITRAAVAPGRDPCAVQ